MANESNNDGCCGSTSQYPQQGVVVLHIALQSGTRHRKQYKNTKVHTQAGKFMIKRDTLDSSIFFFNLTDTCMINK